MLENYDNFKITEPYYNGYRLLSMLDKNGLKPDIYFCTSNRSAGKTTFFNGYVIHQFIKTRRKFCVVFRSTADASIMAEPFFAEIKDCFFKGLRLEQDGSKNNPYFDLYLVEPEQDGKKGKRHHCGYAISLKNKERIKRSSSVFRDVDYILFDEFQTETYLKDEVDKLFSIRDSISRGYGKQNRSVKLFLVGNLLDRFNPYYDELLISPILDIKCNFMRGDGWVLEQGFNQASADSHFNSAFHRAFKNSNESKLSQKKEYSNENQFMIDSTIIDDGVYILTIVHNSIKYSVRFNELLNVFYVSNRYDPSFKTQVAACENDISDSACYFPTIKWRKILKEKMETNMLRCKDMKSKKAILSFIYGKSF